MKLSELKPGDEFELTEDNMGVEASLELRFVLARHAEDGTHQHRFEWANGSDWEDYYFEPTAEVRKL